MAFIYPGIIKVEDGSFEASVSVSGVFPADARVGSIRRSPDSATEGGIHRTGLYVGTPGISLGRFATSESAHMARNGFLESVQMPHNWEESQTAPSPALAAILTGSSSAAPAAPASVIPPPPSVPHMTDTAVLAPPAATDHSPEIPHVSQPSAADQGMLQQQSFQAMHNDATMHSHVNMQGAHNEPELNRGKRNHGLPKGITRRPNSIKYECKVHLSGKRFYVGLFSTVEEALQAQAEKRQQLVDAASRDPDGKIEVATRTTGEDEMVKVKAAVASGSSLEKVKGLRKRKNGRWETQIMHKGVRHYLGTFDTAEEALEARNRRARELSITEATLPSRSPTAKRAKRAASSPTASQYQGAPAAVPMIAPHVALAYQQGMAPPVVFPGQVPGSKDVVQYQPQMVYHHHPSAAPTSLPQQQQHMQPMHMQQPHVPLPEGAQEPNEHNVSTGVPCSMPQSQQDVQPHELTSLRAMMTNPTNVLNMMSGNGAGSLPAGPGAASNGVSAQLDGAAMQSPSSAVNGMPAAIPLPITPAGAQQGGMFADAGMVPPAVPPPAVPPAPDSLPDAQAAHDIPAPHQSPGMLSQTVPHIDHSSGMGLGEMHGEEPPPDAHPLPVDVPAPVSPDEAQEAPLVVPGIPDPGDKAGALQHGVAYNGEDAGLHQFVLNSDAEHGQGSFASPAFAGLSSADTHVNNSGEDVSHLIPVPE